MKSSRYLGLLVPVVLTACTSNPIPTPTLSDLKENHIVTFPASNSFAYVFKEDSNYYTCSQTNVDAGFDSSESGDVEVALLKTGEDGAGFAETSQEVEFSGRTPAVLMSREIFFRTCEFSKNYALNKEEATELFKISLQGIIAAWEIEAKSYKVNITENSTDQSSSPQPAPPPTLPQQENGTNGQ